MSGEHSAGSPEIGPPIGGRSTSRDLRERVLAEERRFLPHCLYEPISGGTRAEEEIVPSPNCMINVMGTEEGLCGTVVANGTGKDNTRAA
jgi:hypothetical protein